HLAGPLQLEHTVPMPAIAVRPWMRSSKEVVREGKGTSSRHVEDEERWRVLDDDSAPADLRLAAPDLPPHDRFAALPPHNPSRSSVAVSRRHRGRTFTLSSRKTGWPSSASISGLARVPMSFTSAPPLPTTICFCDSVS